MSAGWRCIVLAAVTGAGLIILNAVTRGTLQIVLAGVFTIGAVAYVIVRPASRSSRRPS